MQNNVTVFPPGWNVNGSVRLPDGAYLDTSASVTSGLQEAIDFACVEGYDLDVLGGTDRTHKGAVIYWCEDTLRFPPMQGKKIRIGAATLHWSPGVANKPGMVFDSCMMVDYEFCGQLVYRGLDCAVIYQPAHLLPIDPLVIIIDSRFRWLTVGGDGVIAVKYDPTMAGNHGITCNEFDYVEINASQYSILAYSPIAGSRFAQNTIRARHAHGASNTAVHIGSSNPAPNIYGNEWHLGISTEGGDRRGIDTYGCDDTFVGCIDGPVSAPGILIESCANGNDFRGVRRREGGIEDHSPAGSNLY